jgi:ubiquinone/menaquinone biosynthesis C-methylase UbiE
MKYDAWYDKNKFAYLSELKALKKALPRARRGLEIGVGTGRFAGPLGIAMGVDPSCNMIKVARARGVTARRGCGEDLPFWDGSFDYAAIVITICFVKNPLKVLKEARRVLGEKGKIVLGIIDKESFLGKSYRRKKSVFYRHAKFFSVKEITRLLKKAWFGKISYYQTLFKLPESIDRAEKPLEGFGKGGFVVISGEKD